MRLSPVIFALLLASAAAAQTPPPAPGQQPPPDEAETKPPPELTWRLERFQPVQIPPGAADNLSSLPPNARLAVMVEGVRRTVTPSELQELLRQKKELQPLPPDCEVDYSKIDAEQRASDEHLRQMKRNGEAEPVVNQIEQELYYRDRRAKLRELTCGKSPPPAYSSQYKPFPDMQQETCKAMGKVCKPVKHW